MFRWNIPLNANLFFSEECSHYVLPSHDFCGFVFSHLLGKKVPRITSKVPAEKQRLNRAYSRRYEVFVYIYFTVSWLFNLIVYIFFSFRTPSQACNANRRRASTAGLDSNPNDLDTWNNFQEKLPSWQIFRFEFLKLYTNYIFESIHEIPWTVIFQF